MDIFGGAPSTPAPVIPVVTPPPVMPIPDDKAAKDAKRRALSRLASRSGRQSTILSQGDGTDTLGA